MKVFARIAALTAIAVLVLFFAARAFAFHEVQNSGYHTPPAGSQTPESLRIAYENVTIASLTFLLPDVYDNVRQARKLDAPLLIVEGGRDAVAPLAEAQEVESAAAGPKALIVRPRYGHNAPWQTPEMGFWAPIVRFVQTGALSGS